MMKHALRWGLVPGLALGLLLGCDGGSGAGSGAAGAGAETGAVLDGARSGIQFVSVKNAAVAEVHHFPNLGGGIDREGRVTVTIPLAGVQTNIPIRDQRMRDMLFEVASFPTATLQAQVDWGVLDALGVGEYRTMSVSFELQLHGASRSLSAQVGVTRLADGLQVATLAPLLLNTADFGLTEGVERLREVVGLSAIAPVVPVSAQLVFRFGP